MNLNKSRRGGGEVNFSFFFLLDNICRERGWLNIFQKFLGSFEVVLRYFYVVLDIKGAEGWGVEHNQKVFGSF